MPCLELLLRVGCERCGASGFGGWERKTSKALFFLRRCGFFPYPLFYIQIRWREWRVRRYIKESVMAREKEGETGEAGGGGGGRVFKQICWSCLVAQIQHTESADKERRRKNPCESRISSTFSPAPFPPPCIFQKLNLVSNMRDVRQARRKGDNIFFEGNRRALRRRARKLNYLSPSVINKI